MKYSTSGLLRARLANPLVQLGLLGTFSWLAYLRLATAYPLPALVARNRPGEFSHAFNWDWPILHEYVPAMIGAFLLYLLAWRVLEGARGTGDRRLIWLVLGFAALYAVTLVAMYPIGSTDLFDYVFHTRIWVHYGQNPLSIPPGNFGGDPFLRNVAWRGQASPYGPLWTLLSSPGSYLAGEDYTLSLLLMNGLAALFMLGSAWLVGAILQVYAPDRRGVGILLFAWNPLILFEGPGNGHNSIVMMFFVLLAVYLLFLKRWVWVVPALLASALIQYVSAILILPFFIYCWRSLPGEARGRFLVHTSGLCLALLGVNLLFFHDIPSGLLFEAEYFNILAVPSLAYYSLEHLAGLKNLKGLIVWGSAGVFMILYAASQRYMSRLQQPSRLLGMSTWLVIAYLVVACPSFQQWFIVWPLTLGIWLDQRLLRRALIVFTASGLATYAANSLWLWNHANWSIVQVSAMFVTVLYLPPGLVGLWSLLRKAHDRIQSRRRLENLQGASTG